MSKKSIVLPEMGEGIIEATVSQYLVAVGDKVDVDTPILEVATDKVDSEVVSPYEGKVVKLICKENDTVAVGAPIAIIETEGEEDEVTEEAREKYLSTEVEKTLEPKVSTTYTGFVSPTVHTLLQKYKLPINTLDTILPTGPDRRITKEDLLTYIKDNGYNSNEEKKQPSLEKSISLKPIKQNKQPKVSPSSIKLLEGDTIETMGRMRKLIAEHMTNSVQTAPHVTSFIEADITLLAKWRSKVKNKFLEKYGGKLTFTTLFVEAVVKAIKKYPNINVSVYGDSIVKHSAINIGMATALPDGNLIVPVIHNAQKLSLAGIANEVNSLADKARNNKLKPNDIKGGTFTISNLGPFDSLTGTPIINQPEVAILAVGAIKKKPIAVAIKDGNYGVAIRDMMMLAMSYDHRVVDGSLGGNFLKEIRDLLQNFNKSTDI